MVRAGIWIELRLELRRMGGEDLDLRLRQAEARNDWEK